MAGINATLLLLVTATVVVEAVRRLIGNSPQINGLPVVIAGVITMIVMGGCAAIAGGDDDDDDDLHMRSIVLDTLADAVSAGAVAATGGIILWRNGWYWLDAAIAILVGLVIAVQAVRLLGEVVRQLRRPSSRPVGPK